MNKSDRKKKKKQEERVPVTLRKIRKMKRADGLRMKTVDEYTMRAVLRCTVSRNYRYPALKTYRMDDEITYGTMEKYVQAAGSYFYKIGLQKGDRIAIMGMSCPMWMVSYFAVTASGFIAVPILPDFSKAEAEKIVEHSESKAVIVGAKHCDKMFDICREKHIELFRLDDLFHIPFDIAQHLEDRNSFLMTPGIDCKMYSRTKDEIKFWNSIEVKEEDVASIIYTSGTTGASKGVMLTHKNLVWNSDVSTDEYIKIKHQYKALSILPMSHVYEFTEGQILILLSGAEIVYLGKTPAPSILIPAMAEVRPTAMLTVPLLIEKVYRSAVAPVIEKNSKIKKLYSCRLTHRLICRIITRKIMLTFGGKLKFFGIGGAPLDKEVEKFLYDARFPYALGYGLTETSPLVAAHGPKHRDHGLGDVGRLVDFTDVKFDNPNEDGVGEILVKSPSVMKGYYKNPELTAEAFTEDGYFRTGDLGRLNRRGRLQIMGRIKTMILGSGGENIYPESIESLINNQDFVQESLVVPRDGGLVALIKIDIEMMAKLKKISLIQAKDEAMKYINTIRTVVNKELSAYSKISSTELQDEPFVRTPTQKIKRFLYTKGSDKKQ